MSFTRLWLVHRQLVTRPALAASTQPLDIQDSRTVPKGLPVAPTRVPAVTTLTHHVDN